MKSLQTIGGIAALVHAVTLVVGMVLSFTVMFPLLDAPPDQALRFLSDNQTLVLVWRLVVEWGASISFVVMLVALYQRLEPGSPTLTRTGAVFALVWVSLTIATGNVVLRNFGVVANLGGSAAAQAAAWTALARSLWVLLFSLAAVRTGGPTRALGHFGVFLGITGSLTMVPVLAEAMFIAFGPGMIVWSAWAGILMLHNSAATTAPRVSSSHVRGLD